MPDANSVARPDELDDVDRLFARLDRAPVPDDLTARVLASTVARIERHARGARLAVDAGRAGRAGLLAVAGYQLGASLAAGDGLELVQAVFDDLGLLTTAPGDVARGARRSHPVEPAGPGGGRAPGC